MEIPSSFRKLVAVKLSQNFREATRIVVADTPKELKPTSLLVRQHFAGVNASDVNFTAGKYRPGVEPPFDVGFEGVGTVVRVGAAVSDYKPGDTVVSQAFGSFAEYQCVSSRNVRKVAGLAADVLPIDLSGVTASICLEQVLRPQRGEVALVTAAAGGTGLFAVQLLAAKYGCRVFGTCSSERKCALLRELGCYRAINYRAEDVGAVLAREAPSGVHAVYESVGGDMFETALANVATKGRIAVVGNITGYRDGTSFTAAASQLAVPIGTRLLSKSATVAGFFLPHYQKLAPRHSSELAKLVDAGTIRSCVDPRQFEGLEHVADAVEYLHAGANVGKVVVKIA